MPKVSTNLSLDADVKREAQELFADLGLDLSTAFTIFLKQAIRVQGIPFEIVRENPNGVTAAALEEYAQMQQHPEQYRKYDSFQELMDEVLEDA